ncbi:unnamed protein product [Caenorhabditis auriculariae]|uniref:maleylacetoacetate isomerase n=1 Tax=Caenorhabditis auriculariae TaxID=2777116 RepID=A0A8S1H0L5_9PELO|nr:unnamed protein product [Caenorhabditis auriculariae]
MSKQEKPVLYSYWRSSCSWRVRMALAWKDIDYEYKTVNLLSKDDMNAPDFIDVNPAQKVPVYIDKGNAITESLAILEYLEETHPEKPLLPKDPVKRALSRAIALQIGANTQPLQNMSVIKYLNEREAGSGAKWAAFWIEKGLDGVEKMLKKSHGKFAVGDEVSFADLFIPSIVYNAKRFLVDIDQFPTLLKVNEAIEEIEVFQAAVPDHVLEFYQPLTHVAFRLSASAMNSFNALPFCCLFFSTLALSNLPESDSQLFTCLKCTGLRNCDICRGRFCYKMVALDDDNTNLIKRGCLNGTDVLSKVGECSERFEKTTGSIIHEKICICADRDRCNSVEMDGTHVYVLVSLFFAVLLN